MGEKKDKTVKVSESTKNRLTREVKSLLNRKGLDSTYDDSIVFLLNKFEVEE